MTFAVRHVLDVAAPADRVWTVVADLPRYSEWNPFVVAARSSLAVGSPIVLRVRLIPGFVLTQREVVTECVRGLRLCYGIRPLPAGLLRSRRCQEVCAAGGGHSRYTSEFELSGALASGVRTLLGARLEAGFAAAARALKCRAEALA